MIRVSGLKEELEEQVTELSADGMTPDEQLKEIRKRVVDLVEQQSKCLREEILPAVGCTEYSHRGLTTRWAQTSKARLMNTSWRRSFRF